MLKMPQGTVFSYYKPCFFNGLYIKNSDENDEIDFVVSNLVGAVEVNNSEDFVEKCGRMEKGESLSTDFNFSGREGMFDNEQLFAIYEKDDVEKLIKELNQF